MGIKVKIQRDGIKTTFFPKAKTCDAIDILKQNGFVRLNPLHIENYESIQWEGIEFNRLIIRGGDNAVWRFNHWINQDCVEAEIIGYMEDGCYEN